MSARSRTIVLNRWRVWAASLARRRRRLAGRFAGTAAVLARPRLAGSRTVREQRLRLVAPRAFVSNLNLSIHPLLRFDVRPAAAVHRTVHAIHLAIQPLLRSELRHETARSKTDSLETIERFRQSSSSTTTVLEAAPPRPVSEPPRLAPLSLVLQRLRDLHWERRLPAGFRAARDGGAPSQESIARRLAGKVRHEEKPIGAPAVRVLRQDAAAARSDRNSTVDSISPSQRGPAAAQRSAPDSWHETRASAMLPAAAALSPAGVAALTEKVMQQIDRRLHVWRERRGGF